MRGAGLDAVGYRPVLVGVRSGDAWQDYLPATVESLRRASSGAACCRPEVLDAALAGLPGAPGASRTRPSPLLTVVQTWGRVPTAA